MNRMKHGIYPPSFRRALQLDRKLTRSAIWQRNRHDDRNHFLLLVSENEIIVEKCEWFICQRNIKNPTN